jgi:DAK2 domain fusion protein YloV
VLTSLDAAAVRRWCEAGLEALRRHQREIDDLNVFPVPDGDTGTNLVLTFTSAYEAVLADGEAAEAVDANFGMHLGLTLTAGVTGTNGAASRTESEVIRLRRVLRCMARGALLGARGSSGVILSQLLAGLADALSAAPRARGVEVAAALRQSADAGWAAVAEPVEGTVLSVARAAADAAEQALADAAARIDDIDDEVRHPTLVAVCTAAAVGAAEALDRTPSQLEVLARAGVVDAGGRGLVVLLDALVGVVTGTARATAPLARVARDPKLMLVEREAGGPGQAYEVQYLLVADAPAVDRLRARLVELGDALVIVGVGDPAAATDVPGVADTMVHNVHVHVNDVGAAIEAGIEAGRPFRISVVRFADQVSGRAAAVPAASTVAVPAASTVAVPAGSVAPTAAEAPAAEAPAAEARADRAVVVVAYGTGLVQLFESEGALVVAAGSQSASAEPVAPSVGEVLESIMSTTADSVVVLPNDSAAQGVAVRAAHQARAAGRRVAVIPTSSPVQALAAIAVSDPARRFEDDAIAMAEAAGATRWAQLTTAVRDALTSAGPCRAGDALGIVEGEVVIVGGPAPEAFAVVAAGLLDRLLGGGGELITLITGASAPQGLADRLVEHIAGEWPLVETMVYAGGQPHHALLIGVE